MQISSVPVTSSVPRPERPPAPLGTWVSRSDLRGASAEWRDFHGGSMTAYVSTIDQFARAIMDTFDYDRDGTLDAALEGRRVQQYAFGSNRNGSVDPPLFVFPNSTIRQEAVSIEPFIAALTGADKVANLARVRELMTTYDADRDGSLAFTGELEAFNKAHAPVVLDARQMTVEGDVTGGSHSVDDFWPRSHRDTPLPPRTDVPVRD